MSHEHRNLLATLGCVALLSLASAAPALAVAVAPPLGTAGTYVILGTNSSPTSGTVTCTDNGPGGNITGDVGTTGASITNSPPCTIIGATNVSLPLLGSVVTDFNIAYAALASLNPTCDGVIPTTSTTLPPGVWCSAAATTFTGAVTFTLNGSASDVWVFRVGTGGLGALTGTNFSVVMGEGALACNVYWRSAEATTMTNSFFKGTVLSGDAITMTGGSWEGRALAKTDVTVTDVGAVDLAACAPPSSITVNKNFVPDSAAPVSMNLACTSGTVSSTPLNASEGSPAVFTVGGANLTGTTCDATETVPLGYNANQSNCNDVPLNGSCTIINTLATATTFTVFKNFIPDNPAPVSVGLSCSGAVVPTPLTANASEGSPAVFTLTGAVGGDTCTATETAPLGYSPDETDCLNEPLTLNGNSTCTITNTLAEDAITVYKDFLPNSAATVSVTLDCSAGGGVPSPVSQNASEGSPAVFTVQGNGPCTATEIVPLGYTAIQTTCVDVPLGGTCTIFNTLIPPPANLNIPALSGRAMLMLIALLALTGLVAIRRFVV